MSLPLRLIEAEGLRVSEAADLPFGDVDFAEDRIRVSRARTKRRTAGSGGYPGPRDLLDEIAALRSLEDRPRERPVFSGVGSRDIRAGLELGCRDAKVAHYGPHALRHQRCSLWLAHDFEPVFVKQWSAQQGVDAEGRSRARDDRSERRLARLLAPRLDPPDSPDRCRAPFSCGFGVV
ncbi:MAG TPA: site-specific integrase [Gaiellaceae bacterium]|nr:site-specific integrase [Gaiellaceae bacterium]